MSWEEMVLSIAKAKAIAKTLRWYHVGFAFLWTMTFAGLSYPAAVPVASVGAFKLGNQSFVIFAVVAMAFAMRTYRLRAPRPCAAVAPTLALALGALLFYVSFYSPFGSVPLAVVSGILVGSGSGVFYTLWQYFFASEGASRTALYIPLSAVASAGLCLLLRIVPFPVYVACAATLLPLLAGLSLGRALAEVEPRELPGWGKGWLRRAVCDLWRPVFCVCAIGLVWKLASRLFDGAGASDVALFGFAAAALVVAVVELFTERGFEVLRFYQVLFPVITGVFLLPTLFGGRFAPLLSGMLMFGFEIMNLLLIVTCAVYANERGVASSGVYALCIVPTFVSMLTGELLGAGLGAAFIHDLSLVVGILFACVYVLSCTMLLVSWTWGHRQGSSSGDGRQQASEAADAASVQGSAGTSGGSLPATGPCGAETGLSMEELDGALLASLETKLGAMGSVEPLSRREREVAALVARGYSVAAISRKLFISENTVRGHTKNIYRKLDVHSKQQLVDLVDG